MTTCMISDAPVPVSWSSGEREAQNFRAYLYANILGSVLAPRYKAVYVCTFFGVESKTKSVRVVNLIRIDIIESTTDRNTGAARQRASTNTQRAQLKENFSEPDHHRPILMHAAERNSGEAV